MNFRKIFLLPRYGFKAAKSCPEKYTKFDLTSSSPGPFTLEYNIKMDQNAIVMCI
jgi:hypothetical protein